MSPNDKSPAAEAELADDFVASLGFEPISDDDETDDGDKGSENGSDRGNGSDSGNGSSDTDDATADSETDDAELASDADATVTEKVLVNGSDPEDAAAESSNGATEAKTGATSNRSNNRKKKRKRRGKGSGSGSTSSSTSGTTAASAAGSTAAASVAAAGLHEEIKAKAERADISDIADEALVADVVADVEPDESIDEILDEMVVGDDASATSVKRKVDVTAGLDDEASSVDYANETEAEAKVRRALNPATTGEVPVVKVDTPDVVEEATQKMNVPGKAKAGVATAAAAGALATAEAPVPGERPSLVTEFFGNPFDRNRRMQARKVRRVVRHIDPWSVLTFSVLFHMCVFAALLLASVLVWNVAEAAGTIENIEDFILELGDYESFEINGEAIFRAGVAIAGILTLASSVLMVLLTVVFNLLSDLIGGIRVTVIEEETVRIHEKNKSN